MSEVPDFQKLIESQKKETSNLAPTPAPTGGKKRRTKTKRRVKKARRKTRTRKHKRRTRTRKHKRKGRRGKKTMRGGKNVHKIKECETYDMTKLANWCDKQQRETGYPGGMYVDPDNKCQAQVLEWGDCTTAAETRDGNHVGGPDGGKKRRKQNRRKYKRRSTKKRRGNKRRQRKTKNRRRRGGGESFNDRRDRFIGNVNKEREMQGKDVVPRQHITDHIDKMVQGRKNIHEHQIKDALKSADDEGNTKPSWTGFLASVSPVSTSHGRRVEVREEVKRVKENNPTLANIDAAGEKAAELRAKQEVFNNMERHVRGAAQLHDNINRAELRAADAERNRKANAEFKQEQRDAPRDFSNLTSSPVIADGEMAIPDDADA